MNPKPSERGGGAGRGERRIAVLCVDDNPLVIEALSIKLAGSAEFECAGILHDADGLVARAERDRPALVVLDVDMPGRDPFEATGELLLRRPETRVVFFSGHVRRQLIERAIEAGAWGYVSKNDGAGALLDGLRRVADGEFVLSPEARAVYM